MKYFYLKLTNNFFNNAKVILLNQYKNGDKYLLLYLKLATFALQTDGVINTNNNVAVLKAIAKNSGVTYATLKNALETLQQCDLINIADDGVINFDNELLSYKQGSTESDKKTNRAKKNKVNQVQALNTGSSKYINYDNLVNNNFTDFVDEVFKYFEEQNNKQELTQQDNIDLLTEITKTYYTALTKNNNDSDTMTINNFIAKHIDTFNPHVLQSILQDIKNTYDYKISKGEYINSFSYLVKRLENNMLSY